MSGTDAALSPGCVVAAGAEDQPDTIWIALDGDVDPFNAPVPRNDSEQILFGHLYETLITMDCEGRVHPGLAAEWYGSDGGKRWTFRLRRGARFWDGSPVTSRDIVDCWQSGDIEPFIWEAGVDSVAAAGENSIHIYFTDPHEDLPLELSASPFAVARIGVRWPLGTTPGSINIEPLYSSLMFRRPFTVSPVSGTDGPVLVFLEPGSSPAFDSRDLLEGSIDVMITRDPDIVEYASSRSHLETIPLPWSRTYVLLSTTRILEVDLGDPLPGIGREFSDDLARDAVPGVARGHETQDWWEHLDRCADIENGSGIFKTTVPVSNHTEPETYRRILFDRDDLTARSLAERIVGLGTAGPESSSEAVKLAAAIPGLVDGHGRLYAEGIPEEEMKTSLEAGGEFAYMIWLPVRPPDPCTGIMKLIGRARWLSTLGDDLDDALLPLVDTRSYAIVRKGTAGLSIDWYGNIYIRDALSRPAMPPPGR
jgi:hypothetical protein